MKTLTRYLIPRLADRFFVVSEYTLGEFARAGVPKDRLQLLYNPIDTDTFRPNQKARALLRQALGLEQTNVLVGFLGRMVHGKGVYALCAAVAEAMRRQPALHMLWVGDGDTDEMRDQHIPPEQLRRHHFLGWTADSASIYPALDLAVMPSIAPESFGRVSAEAQACGVPVLCSDIGGLPETLQPGISGVLSAPGDAASLCSHILELAADAYRRHEMGERGRQFVNARFSTAQICSQFERVLRCGAAQDTSIRALPG